jgi:RTX calcium-binding nonapeptide repeat (4 copies)
MGSPLHVRCYLGILASAIVVVGLATIGPASAATADSSGPSATVVGSTLTINGTSGPDQIVVALGSDPNTLNVALDGITQTFDRSSFSKISVTLGPGDDQFTEDTSTLIDEALTVRGGSGNDTISGGSGNDVLIGGSGNDTIKGNAGDDTILGGLGSDVVSGGQGNDNVSLGDDSDTFLWDPGDASDVVDGGAGTDTLQFHGSNIGETMSLFANGSRAEFVRDVAAVDEDMNNIEEFDLTTLGGSDQVTINDLTGTSIGKVHVDLTGSNGMGDQQPDVVAVNGTDEADSIGVLETGDGVAVNGLSALTNVSGAESIDQLQINGLGGNDSVNITQTATTPIGVHVDLGASPG